jgi:arginine N-succinyltransferase
VPDRALLRDKLERSLKSFAADDDVSGEEHYLFVLEDRAQGGALVGTSGIAASAGFHDRFYSYRNEYVVQVSPELEARNRIHTLHLCHDLTGVTLLTGFHIDPAHAAGVAPQLLSRGRLLFIAQFPERFPTASPPSIPAWPTTAAAAPSGMRWGGASSTWTIPPPSSWPAARSAR